MALINQHHSVYASRLSRISTQFVKEWLPSILLFVLIIEISVRVTYFAAEPMNDSSFYARSALLNAEGDAFKQFVYLALFVLTMLSAWAVGWGNVIFSVSPFYFIACFWCLISSSWAVNPGISLRRSVLMIVLLYTLATLVNVIGSTRALRVLYWYLFVVILASVLSVALHPISFFSFSIHPGNEGDASLIGCWRGVFSHKNVAGPIASFGIFVFVYFGLNRMRVLDWLSALMSLVLLIGTHSKTALFLTFGVLLIGLIYRSCSRRIGGPRLFAIAGAWILAVAATITSFWYQELYDFFTDPLSITGRVGVWLSMVSYIEDHPLVGSGYGSFFGIGPSSPMSHYAVTAFAKIVSQSHNGYLEIIATTGLIGLGLALVAIVAEPLYRFLTLDRRKSDVYALCFTIWLFALLENFAEAQLFSIDRQMWVVAMIAISIVNMEGRRGYQKSSTVARVEHYRIVPPPRI